jgi:DNA-binding transcriptional ArsR family regulator
LFYGGTTKLFFGGTIKQSSLLSKTLYSVDNFSQDEFTEALESASVKIYHLSKAVEILVGGTLSQKQIEYLRMIREYEGMLFHKLVEEISSRHELPPSTVRWNLSKLREMKLIIVGDQNNKGVPMQLTKEAEFIISMYKNNKQ